MDKLDAGIISDFIQADNATSLPSDYTPAKEKIMGFMKQVHDESPKNWAAIKTIAQGSTVSPVYTRHVLDQLQEEKKIERGLIGKKAYYRFVPVEKPKATRKSTTPVD